ncbi:hypothetical protein [Luteibacter aegosomatissinici]|uniref:hypothetical protein n=1 Tax=Luteibacter aegosomatissinici TaxID=2911539 RepID=UPI001FF9D186|nr:hypothetical protein [Luteibacter aegosomatissinici]UPG92864.1 hypothetical protein L2Y97_13415 [Luteibacter aegosomatissinici]
MGPSVMLLTRVHDGVPTDPDYEIAEVAFLVVAGTPGKALRWRESRAREYVIRAKGGSKQCLSMPSKSLAAARSRIRRMRRSIDARRGAFFLRKPSLIEVFAYLDVREATPVEERLIKTMLDAQTFRHDPSRPKPP